MFEADIEAKAAGLFIRVQGWRGGGSLRVEQTYHGAGVARLLTNETAALVGRGEG